MESAALYSKWPTPVAPIHHSQLEHSFTRKNSTETVPVPLQPDMRTPKHPKHDLVGLQKNMSDPFFLLKGGRWGAPFKINLCQSQPDHVILCDPL